MSISKQKPHPNRGLYSKISKMHDHGDKIDNDTLQRRYLLPPVLGLNSYVDIWHKMSTELVASAFLPVSMYRGCDKH